MPKQKFNFRLSDDAKRLLELMSKKTGITQTAVLELSIRNTATDLSVTLSSPASTVPAPPGNTPPRQSA